MSNKKYCPAFALIFFFILSSISFGKGIADLIQPLNLSAGTADSVVISDVFYTEDYNNIKLVYNPSVEIIFNYDKTKLILTPDKNFEGITLAEFSFGGNTYEIPVRVNKEQYITFKFKPEQSCKNVFLFGSFNSWNRSGLEMKSDNGIWKITIPLEPGRYQYKFFADGSELTDPENPEQIPNGMGGYNSVLTVEAKHKTNPFLHIGNYSPATNADNDVEFSFIYQNDESNNQLDGKRNELSEKDIIALLDNQKIPASSVKISGEKIIISLNNKNLKGKRTLRVAVTKDDQATNIQNIILFDGKPAGNKKNFTWHDAIIYSAIIDRFDDGDSSIDKPIVHDSLFKKANYMGGDFQGIINKFNDGYFDSLGITALWISPVYDNTNHAFREFPKPHRWFSGYHGYWPIKPRSVEEEFGTMDKLQELVEAAHKHNIKVLLDIVAHHVHEEHPYFKEHPDWFGHLKLPDGTLNIRMWDEHRLTTWFEPFMPSFDFIHSEAAVEAVTNDAIWWLEKVDADGFRQDAVKHIPNNFWRRLNQKLEKEVEIPQHKKVFQMGETFGSYALVKSYINNGQLPAQFNFNLYDVAIPTFLKQDASFEQLDKEIKKGLYIFGENNLMGNIMDSQDKDRFMAYADSDLTINDANSIEIGWNNPPKVDHKSSYKKERLYLSYLLSIPGIPTIYYGDEIGMTGAADPDNRRMMRFGDQLNDNEKENLIDVRKIIHLRDNHPALRYGDYYSLKADTNFFAYLRSDMNERVLVVLNKNPQAQNVNIELPDFYKTRYLVDLLSGEKIDLNENKINITVKGISYRFFNLEK